MLCTYARNAQERGLLAMADQTNSHHWNWHARLTNHNPFYVISAVLMLYGLHISFSDNLDPTRGWLQLQLFLGYILLLSLTGILIVRYGKVWEDARTLFLIILLLFIALSNSFDRVCLDNEYLGLQFLGISLVSALAICESVLWFLAIRLPWFYRMVLYLQLAIMFCYPPWLGHLSLTDQTDSLGWLAMGFSTLIAASNLLLLPAARRGGQELRRNGTPWGWPMYPWTLFVILWIGIVIRSWSLTYSFDPTKGFNSGFQPYFLIPLFLSIIVITAESCIRQRENRTWTRFVVAPFLVAFFSFPGQPVTIVQARYLSLLQESIGSPAQITAMLLIGYFVYLMIRRVRAADWGLAASIGMLSVVNHNTLDLQTIQWVNPLTAYIAIVFLASCAILRRCSSRLCVAVNCGIMVSWHLLTETIYIDSQSYLQNHILVIATLLIGFTFNDLLGRIIRLSAGLISLSAAVASFVTYRNMFPEVPMPWHSVYALILAAIAVEHWRQNRETRYPAIGLICLAISLAHFVEYILTRVIQYPSLKGGDWIVGGIAFFSLGLTVSLIKGGLFRFLYRTLHKIPANEASSSD